MTTHDYKALQLYNQINVLQQNNRKGRYDSEIQNLKKELEKELKKVGENECKWLSSQKKRTISKLKSEHTARVMRFYYLSMKVTTTGPQKLPFTEPKKAQKAHTIGG